MANKILFLLFTAFTLTAAPTWAAEPLNQDPYSAVEFLELKNGLKVYLAPSSEASLTNIRLEVGVGDVAESGPTIGISHLLEHVLFRDKNLADQMSYLQLIREAGGSANGGTGDRQTNYYGSIPADKGAWLFETMTKMILEPTFEDSYVQKEKGTIELERGRPSPIVQALRMDPMELIRPSYLEKPSFWESEFSWKKKANYSLSEEQLSTQQLTTAQVQKHYEDYYYPTNMKLFIAGKFDREKMLQLLNDKWGNLPPVVGKSIPPEPQPELRDAPYIRSTVSTDPAVAIGTKIWGANQTEQAILNSYTEFLAHRMMKEIRNIKGQTYTASADNYVYKGFGYATVYFKTPKENFSENLEIARNYFTEGREGKLSKEQIEEALNLQKSKFHLRGKEAENMMDIAVDYADIVDQYGAFSSPYAALASATPESYNQTLSKFLKPELAYEQLNQPPYFFHYDVQILYALSLIFAFMGFRALLTQKFHNDKVQWVRKVQYPPLKLLETLVFIAGWYLYSHLQYVVDQAFRSDYLQSHIFISQYIYSVVSVLCLIGVAQGLYSLMPRKLMVHEKDLLIKSVTYFSKKIPLSEIARVEAVRTLTYPFPLSRWLGQVKHRYFFFTAMYWQKGLLVTLKNGKGYYFSVKNAEQAKNELQGFLKAPEVASLTVAEETQSKAS